MHSLVKIHNKPHLGVLEVHYHPLVLFCLSCPEIKKVKIILELVFILIYLSNLNFSYFQFFHSIKEENKYLFHKPNIFYYLKWLFSISLAFEFREHFKNLLEDEHTNAHRNLKLSIKEIFCFLYYWSALSIHRNAMPWSGFLKLLWKQVCLKCRTQEKEKLFLS